MGKKKYISVTIQYLKSLKKESENIYSKVSKVLIIQRKVPFNTFLVLDKNWRTEYSRISLTQKFIASFLFS